MRVAKQSREAPASRVATRPDARHPSPGAGRRSRERQTALSVDSRDDGRVSEPVASRQLAWPQRPREAAVVPWRAARAALAGTRNFAAATRRSISPKLLDKDKEAVLMAHWPERPPISFDK